jgi:hypothetical protein
VAPGRRVFGIAFVACWALGASWAAASPPFSGPDEGAHVFRAYAAAGGELIGEDTAFRRGIIGRPTLVEVPRSLGDRAAAIGCFVFKPPVPAGCATGDPRPGEEVYETGAGRNPPLYHALVSPPLRLWPSLVGLYLARLIGAGVAAALLAGVVAVCWTRRRPGILAGSFLAYTPMAWFLSGVVNTSSLEIAGGVAAWAGGLALLDDWRRGERAGGGALALLVAGGVAVAQARSLGPLWLALIGAVLAAGALADGSLRRLLEDHRAQLAAAAVGLAAAANVAWIVGSGALDSSGERDDLSLLDAVWDSFNHQMMLWRTGFDTFGWFDAIPPMAVAVTWVGCGLALLVVGLSVARRPFTWLLGGVLAMAVVVPVFVEASQRPELGAVWQGRYTLPLLGGVPIVAGWLLDRHPELLPAAGRILGSLVVVATLAHATGYWFALRRYAVGAPGDVWFFRGDTWLTWKLVPVTLGGIVVIVGVGLATRWGVATLSPALDVERPADGPVTVAR